MEQSIAILAKFSKDDKLFAYQDKPISLIPVTVNGISQVSFLSDTSYTIIYTVTPIKCGLYCGPSFEINEIDLYKLDEMERFVK